MLDSNSSCVLNLYLWKHSDKYKTFRLKVKKQLPEPTNSLMKTPGSLGFPEAHNRQSLSCHWLELSHIVPPSSRKSGKDFSASSASILEAGNEVAFEKGCWIGQLIVLDIWMKARIGHKWSGYTEGPRLIIVWLTIFLWWCKNNTHSKETVPQNLNFDLFHS